MGGLIFSQIKKKGRERERERRSQLEKGFLGRVGLLVCYSVSDC